MPGVIAERWFPLDELSFATAIAAGGMIFGNSIGYLLPALIIRGPVNTFNSTFYPSNWAENKEALEEVQFQMLCLFAPQAIFAVVMFSMVIVGIPALPELPPSVTAAKKRQEPEKLDYIDTVKACLKTSKSLAKNRNWLLLQAG
jgi:hypothetical protein